MSGVGRLLHWITTKRQLKVKLQHERHLLPHLKR
jgi:hypothetical protein